MEVESSTPMSTEQSAPAMESASAPQSASVESSTAQPNTDASIAQETPAWKPDFKFKVMDQEHEIEEWARSGIKDEDTLKKVKRLHEQAYGIKHIETSRDEFKNKYQTVAPQAEEYAKVSQSLNRLSHFVEKKDFGSFFDNLKIPRAEVFKWVQKEINFLEHPPEIQQQLRAKEQYEAQLYDIQNKMSVYEQQLADANRMQAQSTVGTAIETHAKDLATVFNERAQDPQAFYNAVMNHGAQIQQATGQKLPVEEVVKIVAEKAAKFIGYQPQTVVNPAVPTDPTNTIVVKAGNQPTIPNARAGGSSPVKRSFKSIDEIKKHAASL